MLNNPRPHIAPRVLEVATLKAAGLTGKEIAAQLNISIQTVKNHTTRLYSVLGVSSFEAAACELGWMFPGGITAELVANALEKRPYMETLRFHEALDDYLASGRAQVRQAQAMKALLRADPRAGRE